VDLDDLYFIGVRSAIRRAHDQPPRGSHPPSRVAPNTSIWQDVQSTRNHPVRNFFGADFEENSYLPGSVMRASLCCIRPQLRCPDREIAHALNHADALGHRNRPARVEED
jgi:hypothetical protein